jgi:hypothetical protein
MDNPVIDEFGNKRWYLNGVCHRTDGPACEWVNGNKSWYVNGQHHRTDGPASEFAGGKSWWLNNQVYSFDNWLEENTDLTDGEKVMMKLQYG